MIKLQTILVTGSNGQLGFELSCLAAKYPWFNFVFADRQTLDISNQKSLAAIFNKYKFNTVINCAAYTAVDKAETEQKVAYEINAYGVKLLAEWCATQEANLFHISTDFVFDGEATIPYTEESSTNPLSVYGKSKLEGETAALAYKKSYVIRTSWVYSSHGKNFVKTMLRLASEKPEIRVVNDQWGCPTYAADLADVLLNMATLTISIKQSEIFHYCNNGAITWYDFAKKIIQLSNISTPVIPISTIEYPTPASRPKYSVLDTNKIKNRFNLTIPSWQNSLSRCLHKIPLH